MKKIAQLFLLVLILVSIKVFPQNLLNDYPGIPIITRLPDWDWSQHHTDLIDSMKKAGVDFVTLKVENEDFIPQMNLITSKRLKVIPHKSRGLNYIRYYTDAKYSIWEAEGTPPEVSEAMLSYDTAKCEIVDSGYVSFVRIIPDSAVKTFEMIYGPYYDQQVYEITPADTFDFARYTTIFRLKLEKNENYPDTTSVENIFDPICKLQITQSYVSTQGGIWHLPCTYPIKDSLITRGQFQQLNNFINFSFNNYILDCDSCQSLPPSSPPPQHQIYATDNSVEDIDLDGLEKRHYIQFKVFWLGNPRYLLSVDKVTVYDDKGFQLIEGDPLVASTLIGHQIQTLSPIYDSSLAGWLGIDEPVSIDNFAPIKRVVEILNNYGNNPKPLWLALMGHWDGVWENRDNIFGTYHLSPWSEMKKRIGKMNFWQDAYYFDYPWNDTLCNNCTEPWYGQNIRIAAELNYKRAQTFNPDFGVSIQCGEIHIPGVAEQRNILGYELLYETNLALLYGAKYLDLYTYFAMCDTDGYNCTGTTRGIIDSYRGNYYYTGKYDTLYHIINPRLKGMFGKTIKELIPVETNVGLENIVTNKRFIKWIAVTDYNPSEADHFWMELGFFNDSIDLTNKYFMVINRYTNAIGQNFSFRFQNLDNYRNWKVMNYCKEASSIILADQNGEAAYQDTITKGDGCLYSILPVVKYGGKLIADETIPTPTTLTEDMTIENGATLYINSTYTANANITVRNGGKIIGGANGSIVFTNNHQLLIEGFVQVNGTSSNILAFNFSQSGSDGIIVKQGAVLTMTYCDIKNAKVGINSETGSSVNISYVNFTNCRDYGISLVGLGSRQRTTLPTPVVNKCNINGSTIGISVINFSEAVVKGNTINNSHLGVFLNQINKTHLLNNSIIGYLEPYGSSMAGIIMISSAGYLRNNTIKYHRYGVQLAYSSPDMGSNTIEENSECGLYADVGSKPNLVFNMVNPNCWYPIRGCNIIKNNGRYNGVPPISTEWFPTGTEIYLNYADIVIKNGGNMISDDRQNIPVALTLPLINGNRGDEVDRELQAEMNYWGIAGPTPERFGTLNVNYNPWGDYCPLPLMPCTLNDIIVQTADGISVDTLISKEATSANVSALELEYAEADKLYISGEINEAKTIYEQILQNTYGTEDKLSAYNKMYEIGNLQNEAAMYFNALQTEITNILSTETDTILQKRYRQNSILCDISKEEYLTAIAKFDDIIQQNPESEEAVYAEIDILTTSLNLDTTNNQLGKVAGGKYLVKGSSDYMARISEIMTNKFGSGNKAAKQIIPTEYSLSQNYPNPFNPATKIKYQLPNTAQVSLKVYDILGREVATLVNEEKQAGYYETTFNASNLSSGCYFYQIVTKDFVKTMKMLIIK